MPSQAFQHFTGIVTEQTVNIIIHNSAISRTDFCMVSRESSPHLYLLEDDLADSVAQDAASAAHQTRKCAQGKTTTEDVIDLRVRFTDWYLYSERKSSSLSTSLRLRSLSSTNMSPPSDPGTAPSPLWSLLCSFSWNLAWT